MARPKEQSENLLSLLRLSGTLSTQELLERLGVSRATLARWVQSAGSAIIRVGRTNQTRYGVPRPIPALGHQLPVFRVTSRGELKPLGKLIIFHGSHYGLEPQGETHIGLPPEIADMRPQGFMGRNFARQYASELGVPSRLEDWSNDHILAALARRGEDLCGNLVLGQESAERWERERKRGPHETRRSDYPKMIQAAIAGQPEGSSAGGEQPKFSVVIDHHRDDAGEDPGDSGTAEHRIVKFAGIDGSPAQKRWRDLLVCEEIALEVLRENGLPASRARIHLDGDLVFLEISRFDRIGWMGRRSVLTLAAIADYFYGARDDWSVMAERMERDGKLPPGDARAVKLLDAFGAWIADTDRHGHNIAFFPAHANGVANDSSLRPEKFTLAPAFDKLPMFYAPVLGQVRNGRYPFPVPRAELLEVWDEARSLGLEFWRRACGDKRVSEDFRRIARASAEEIDSS